MFSTQDLASFENSMVLNWTSERGYPPHDWYPFRTKGGIHGETVEISLAVDGSELDNFCGISTGFKVLAIKYYNVGWKY